MSNPWDNIQDLRPDLQDPLHIVEELFNPIYEKTSQKVKYKLHKVNYFPEEVTYTVSIPLSKMGEVFGRKKKKGTLVLKQLDSWDKRE
jgi:hypothetical protein